LRVVQDFPWIAYSSGVPQIGWVTEMTTWYAWHQARHHVPKTLLSTEQDLAEDDQLCLSSIRRIEFRALTVIIPPSFTCSSLPDSGLVPDVPFALFVSAVRKTLPGCDQGAIAAKAPPNATPWFASHLTVCALRWLRHFLS
jgi:hypothetical protein